MGWIRDALQMTTVKKGQRGEEIAANYLKRNGYRIIRRNFSCKVGEIDIIAQHEGYLVFVEVRSRTDGSSLNPIYTIDRHKQERIVRAAQVYLDRHFTGTPQVRFDVAIVTVTNPPSVEVIPDAFWAT
ncbi:MAG: YraN family protein [Thermodesulfobacteriota bacterium]